MHFGQDLVPPESTCSRLARRKLPFRRGRGLPGRPFQTAQDRQVAATQCRPIPPAVRLSPGCAVAGHSAATGSVESPQKLSGFEVDQGSSRPWDSRRLSSVRISCVGASETIDDSPVHDDGPEEDLLDHVHVVGGDEDRLIEQKTLERHDLNVPQDFGHHDSAEGDAHGACADGNRAV